MTREEIMQLSQDEIEQRRAAIAIEVDAASDADALNALNAELDILEKRSAAIEIEKAETRKAAEAVAAGAGKPIEHREGDKHMTDKEIRSSKEYADAYVKFIKTGKADECRALLTMNGGGDIPVPSMVEARIRQAWERDEIWQRLTKTYVPGNLMVGFELSATPAAIHAEGKPAPDEEDLKIGVVNLVPKMIKKWITVSDEVMALGSEDFLAYLYDEITYKIFQLGTDGVVELIIDAPAESTIDDVGVPKISGAVTPSTILDALAVLSDSARDRVFIASGATIASVRKAALNGNYAYDPFFGLTVIQKDAVTTGAVIGDLAGVQVNLPEGDSVKFKFDDLSLAEKDLVKIVGRMYAAVGIVQPGAFAYITGQD